MRIYSMMGKNKLKERWDSIPKDKKLSEEVTFRLWKNIEQSIRPQIFTISRLGWLCAAVLIIIAGLTFVLKINTVKNIDIKTAKGEILLVKLSDGTKVWVNEFSDFKYPEKFTEGERNVQLNGEAFFEVAKDPAHPFIITSKGLRTKVLGTSFTVYARNTKDTYVSVVTGKVNVTKTNTESETNILPGQKGMMGRSEDKIVIKPVKPQPPDWKYQILDINDKTLQEVIEELKKAYNKNIKINNEKLATEKLNGTLDLRKSLHANLNILTFTLNANITTNDQLIIIDK